jgi:AMMECR1 domain-containing protein
MSAEHSLPVALAWASIRAFLQTGKRPDLSAAQIVALLARAKSEGDVWHADYRALSERQAGAFVSLHVAATSALRGCIGTIAATQANVLAEIVHNAISAASDTSRGDCHRPLRQPVTDTG